jgi:hypothetical protein
MNQKGKMLRVSLAVMVTLVTIIGISSCEKYNFTPPTINPTDSVHFSTVIQTIFTSHCINCHNGSIQSPDLRDGKSYESLTTGSYVSLPANASLLYSQITSSSHTPRTTDLEKQEILVWIEQGFHNN